MRGSSRNFPIFKYDKNAYLQTMRFLFESLPVCQSASLTPNLVYLQRFSPKSHSLEY